MLSPCPFCGNKEPLKHTFEGGPYAYIYCEHCLCRSGMYLKEHVDAAWNVRVTDQTAMIRKDEVHG